MRKHLEGNGLIKTFLWVTAKSLKSIASISCKAIDFDVWIIGLDKIVDYEESRDNNYHCKQPQIEDLSAIEKRFGKAVSVDFVKRIKGSTGYLILDEDEIIGYAWSSTILIKNQGLSPFFFDI